MKITKYGIQLRRVTVDDIERIRRGRNRHHVRSNMFDKRLITRQEQAVWFESINNNKNFYFVISHDQKDVGLIYGKNTDWEKRENEGGIFIWDESCLSTGIPALASVILLQLSFSIAELERVYATVQPSNIWAQQYNLSQGYSFIGSDKEKMVLTKDSYHKRIDRLHRMCSKGKDLQPLSFNDIELAKNDQYYLPLFIWEKYLQYIS